MAILSLPNLRILDPTGKKSLAEIVSELPLSERELVLGCLSSEQLAALRYSWEFWGRPSQMTPPGDWRTWLIMAGRGFGKSRTGAEWIRAEVEAGKRGRVALVAETAADARDVMVEGEAGLLSISHPSFMPKYEPSKRRISWPNGAIATTYSAEDPDQLRGPQHDGAWADEIAKWRYPEAWDQLQFGLRVGRYPRTVATTTPRPTKFIMDLAKDKLTVVTGGSTYENAANLAPTFLHEIKRRYEGTRMGRQEIYAQILNDNPRALWKRDRIDKARVSKPPNLRRIVVAVDPSANEGDNDELAETGIVVAGKGFDGHCYILGDLSVQASPGEWGQRVVRTYQEWKADRVVAEVNNGGAMVRHIIQSIDPAVSYKAVTATRGKVLRAEPISALDEQGKVHHVGFFADLEDQLCSWMPGMKSPDRLDAYVWAVTELMFEEAHHADDVIPDSFEGVSKFAYV
jgi:phage terminase large subunit-like protein